MPTILQFRRGTTSQADGHTGSEGELTIDTTLDQLRIHDGATAGGFKVARHVDVMDRMQVANAQALFDTLQANLVSTTNVQNYLQMSNAQAYFANTNTWILRTDSNLGSTNTALRTLIDDRMQVANAQALFDTLQANLVSTTNVQNYMAVANTQALVNARLGATATVTLTGDVSGSASFSSNSVSITTTIADDSHNHTISNVDGLQAALNTKMDTSNAQSLYTTLKANSAPWSSLISTNTAIRLVVADRMQVSNTQNLIAAYSANNMSVANTQALYNNVTANLNSYKANTNPRITNILTSIGNTNTAIRAVAATKMSVANVQSLIANETANSDSKFATWTALTSTNTAIRSYVDSEVAGLVDSAPETLNTLNELAAALGDDANFATTLTTNLGQKLGATASVTLTGDATGSGSFSSNSVSISTTLADTGTPTGVFGSSTKIPVISVNSKGQITNISNTTVAGVSSVTFTSGNNNLRIAVADGTTHDVTISVGDKMTVANTQALHSNITANLNSYIANTNPRISNILSSISSTNTSIRTLVNSNLANTNYEIDLLNTNLTSTNTAIRTLVNNNLANTNAEIDLLNTNLTSTNTDIRSLISSNDTDITNLQTEDGNLWSAITATNTAIRSLVTSNDTDISNLQTLVNNNLANTNAEIDLLNTNLTNTNTAIRALISSNDTDISNLQTEDGNLWSAITATNTAIRSITTTNANKISQVESNLLATNTSIRSAISTEVANLVDSAPGTLDTLNELAAALGDDANFSTTVTNSIATKMSVANTNTLVNDRMQVANTNTLVNDRMQVANTTLLVNDRMQVANAQALYTNITANLNSYTANTNARIITLEGKTTAFNTDGKISGHLLPSANVNYDLGSTELAFRDLYLSGSTINIDGTSISANSSGFFFTDQDSNQTVNISSENGIVVNGTTIADGTGQLDSDAIGQGYTNSTVYSIPTDWGDGETYPGQAGAGTDAFGINIGGFIYDAMEPSGRYATSYDFGSVA